MNSRGRRYRTRDGLDETRINRGFARLLDLARVSLALLAPLRASPGIPIAPQFSRSPSADDELPVVRGGGPARHRSAS